MPAGSAPASLAHPNPEVLPVGTKLWHVYPDAYLPTDFNAGSKNRFAAWRKWRAPLAFT